MNQKEFIKDKLEAFAKDFCVMLERAERDNGESATDWQIKIEDFLTQILTDQAKMLEAMVNYQFRVTEEMKHSDELHCGCMGYCEYLIVNKFKEHQDK